MKAASRVTTTWHYVFYVSPLSSSRRLFSLSLDKTLGWLVGQREARSQLQRGVVVLPPVPAVLAPRRLAGTPRRIIDAGPGAGRSAGHLHALPGAAVGDEDVVVPADGVGAVQVAAMPDRVPQLDVGRIGDHRLVVRLKLRTVAAGPEQPRRAEELEEHPLELTAVDHVDDEVDAAVDGHQQIADLHHPLRRIGDERLVDVRGERQDVADQEDYHHAQQHRRQADLATLMTRQLLQVPVRFPHLQVATREIYIREGVQNVSFSFVLLDERNNVIRYISKILLLIKR